MDGSQFDTWTRRGFGAAAGGLAGSLLAASGITSVAVAKKGRKKKKRCKTLGENCQANGGKNKKCCCGLACHPVNAVPDSGTHCCHLHGEPCTTENGAQKCCSGTCSGGFCLCKTNGQSCTESKQCCSGFCDASTNPDTCQPAPNNP